MVIGLVMNGEPRAVYRTSFLLHGSMTLPFSHIVAQPTVAKGISTKTLP
jgi:hypothetical protein